MPVISAAFDSPLPGSRIRAPSRALGFSLVEIAIVLFLMVLLLGSILGPLQSQVEQRQISETEATLDQIREALVGFAIANGYLPCPDKMSSSGAGTAKDGIEDVAASGSCVNTSLGLVPWVTLGVPAADVWGNRFWNQVSADFSQRSPLATFNLSSAATINVCNNESCSSSNRLTAANPNGAVAVVISAGRNGKGAYNALTGNANPAPSSDDERENTNGPANFVSRVRTDAGSPAEEFDDVVTWLSKPALFSRMIAAGKLP